MLYTDEESLVSNSVSLASDEDIKITPSVNLVKIGKIRKPKVYSKEILELEKEINNSTTNNSPSYASIVKNNVNSLTVCPSHKVKKTANKPIIKGRLSGLLCDLFLDSGDEINVIDKSFLNKLKQRCQVKEMTAQNKTIKCANKSKMMVHSKVVLDVCLGVKEEKLTFLVVENLSPKVIIGLRGLKTLEADLIPKNDIVRCKGIEIPFMGRTIIDSVYQKNLSGTHKIGASPQNKY